jgi:hypothetical protein
VLEDAHKPSSSYRVLSDALQKMRGAAKDTPQLSTRERLRGVAMALKLGELADTCKMGESVEESWLVWSVDEILKTIRADTPLPKPNSLKPKSLVVLGELPLPAWVTTADVGAPIEALGAFYARTGQPE